MTLSDKHFANDFRTNCYLAKDVKEFIDRETSEIEELKKIVYGDTRDTTNLEGFKGLVKNQIKILEMNRRKEAGGKLI